MLERLITWSLAHRATVLLGALALAVAGAYSFRALEIDAFPDTTPVQVQINAVAPALAPEEIEQQLTIPVEAAISGLPRLEMLRSISKFGLSQVVATFEDGTDVYFARQLVAERLNGVELRAGLRRPEMGPVSTGLGEVLHYVVKSRSGDLAAARTYQDWVLRPALLAVPGVAEVNSWGGFEKRYEVLVDPRRLKKYELELDDVLHAVVSGNVNVGGGVIPVAGEMLLVHGIGRVASVEQIGDVVVETRHGKPIRVRDVADVVIGHEVRRGAVTDCHAGEAVLGLGFMLMGENSHEVTAALKHRLDAVAASAPEDLQVETLYDRTELVDHVMETVRNNLLEGGLLVIAVLFVFLGSLRAGLIVALAIPLSMLFAFSGMLRFAIAGSLMSLGAIDFGLVVDSSVIMVENVSRRLGGSGARGKERLAIVRDAALEVRRPTMFGELIIILVYLPVLTLEGVEGKMFRPMALTVVLALAGSLLLSLTVMPVLASLLLPRGRRDRDARAPWVTRFARLLYAPVLRRAMNHSAAVLTAVAALFLGTLIVFRGLGAEFVPRLSEGAVAISVVRLAGTDLEESTRANQAIERALLAAFPDEIRHVWSRAGSAEVATDPMGVELSDVFVSLTPRAQWRRARTQEDLVAGFERELRDLLGQNLAYSQPIEMRLNEMVAGVRSDVAVKLFGDDLATMTATAEAIGAELRGISGATDVAVEQITGQPVLRVRTDPDALARYGARAVDVLTLVEAVGGVPAGEVIEGQLRFPLVLRLPERDRATPEALARVDVSLPDGGLVPLERLARVATEEGPSTLTREWGQRRITIQCNVRGRDVGSFVEEARARVATLPLPSSRYRVEWGGQFEHLERARVRLARIVPVALLLIFLLLRASLGSARLAWIVFSGVPLAVSGGVGALWLRAMPFSISAAVGFVALTGVAVLNGLVLLTFIRDLERDGMDRDSAVVEGAITRLRPVLMTALVAALGFVPMALATGTGAEVQRPLATVVIGGVISSTLLTLVVLPVLYRLFGPTPTPLPVTDTPLARD